MMLATSCIQRLEGLSSIGCCLGLNICQRCHHAQVCVSVMGQQRPPLQLLGAAQAVVNALQQLVLLWLLMQRDETTLAEMDYPQQADVLTGGGRKPLRTC